MRKLYAEIARMNAVHAGKITGMMLELLACRSLQQWDTGRHSMTSLQSPNALNPKP